MAPTAILVYRTIPENRLIRAGPNFLSTWWQYWALMEYLEYDFSVVTAIRRKHKALKFNQ